MQIGFNAPPPGPLIEPDSFISIITEGEALGFDYVTISDHIMVPRNLESKYPYTDTGEFPAGTQAAWLDQLGTTAFIAALTKKLRFVLSVMVVPHRPAVLTAKLLSTIDYLSKGRLTLGIGVGWCREEFEAIGAAPFDDRGHCHRRMDGGVPGAVDRGVSEIRRQIREVRRRDLQSEAGAKSDPDLGRWRKRPGAAADRSVRAWLVSGRHEPSIPDEHGQPVQEATGTIPRLCRKGRPKSGGDRCRVARAGGTGRQASGEYRR